MIRPPASIGESYPRHPGVAGRFGLRRIASGLAALVRRAPR